MIKKLVLSVMTISLFACASLGPKPEELKKADTCMVWKEDRILKVNHTADIKDETAKQKITCWVMNMFLCSYDNYAFENGGPVIKSDVFGDRALAKLEGNRMTVNMPGTTIDPFEIKNGRVDYTMQAMGPKQTGVIEYNQKCSTRQVAVGLLTLIGK